MDFQNIESSAKKFRRRQEKILDKMWHAENIKSNLSKIINYRGRVNDNTLNTPSDASLTSSNIYTQKPSYQSPRSQPIPPLNFTAIRDKAIMSAGKKCSSCENSFLLLRQKTAQVEKLLQKYNALVDSHGQIFLQRQKLRQKVFFLQRQLSALQFAIQPYQNNVNLMQKHLDMIKQGVKENAKVREQKRGEQSKKQHWRQRKDSPELQVYLVQKYYERQQKDNEQKLCHLNDLLSLGEIKIIELKKSIETVNQENYILKKIINQSEYVNQQRQLSLMTAEQLRSVKVLFLQERQKRKKQTTYILKLRNKIYMLTSLIGYGVLSNLESNDLHQLAKFRDSIQNGDSIKRRLTFQSYGMNHVKTQEWAKALISQYIEAQQSYRSMYQENILCLYQAQQIKTALEQTTATIIKPQFFLLIRSILDSKYLEYVTEGVKSSKFVDFAFNFISCFRVNKSKKRIQLNSKKSFQDGDYFKTNFLLRLFDHKIGFLPEIVTLREFLLRNTADDEVFYYLMVRNIIYNGPQVQNYVICSEPYNFVPFNRTISRVNHIISYLDKNTKAIILNHLAEKKVVKNRKVFIKGNYVSRVLLQVYRKVKREKIAKLRNIFEQTSKCTGSNILKLPYFRQLVQKNFPNIENLSIVSFYRETLSIFNSNLDSSFFQCFHSSCLDKIFLGDNLKANETIRIAITNNESTSNLNYLIQLIPDSVVDIGNIKIYDEYSRLIKENRSSLQKQIRINQFLIKLIDGKLQMSPFYNREAEMDQEVEERGGKIQRYTNKTTGEKHQKDEEGQGKEQGQKTDGVDDRTKKARKQEQEQKQALKSMIGQLNKQLIDSINKNFQKRLRYQQKLEQASSRIGRQAKKKICQFYSDFIKDIKGQLPIP